MSDQIDPKKFVSIELDVGAEGSKQDPIAQILMDLKKSQDEGVRKSIKAISLAFDEDPTKSDIYASIYRKKHTLMPNDILKRIRDSEEMVGGVILPHRAKQGSLFARPRANRFDIGFAINILPEILNQYTPEQLQEIKNSIVPQLRDLLMSCGSEDGVNDKDKRTFSQFFIEIIEDFLTFGAFAVEVRRNSLKKEFHSFRARDAGTMFFTSPQKARQKEAQNLRDQAIEALKAMYDTQGNAIDIAKFEKDEYTYVQVIDGRPRQAFTDKELLYWSGTPSTDINRSGYPTNPIERMITAITTHINLSTHNKLYFVNGRAARNVMVFKSENLEESDISAIKAQMVAHINSANASWRMPVFGMGANDSVEIMPLDSGGRDMEFQYLADLNKRMIFAAFQMSPDEVAALSYLSRGTNSQALSEGNNEWKLTAARDTGLRPLLLSIEDFLNKRLLPQINSEWSKVVQINLEGLDADSPEKEATRLQQDSAIFLNMDEIMERVDKDPLPIGGKFPLNAAYLQLLEKYYTKGQILKVFGGDQFKEADKNPDLAYYMNDPVWLQLQAQKQQAAMAQQGQPGQPGAQDQQQESLSQGEDLDSALNQANQTLSKSESNLPTARKELLKRHKIAKKKILDSFEEESKHLMDSLMGVLSGKKTDDGHEH